MEQSSKRHMICCDKLVPWDEVARNALIKHCDKYPGLVAVQIVCPGCKKVLINFAASEIEIFRRLDCPEYTDNAAAERIAAAYRRDFPDREVIEIHWLGYERRLALSQLHAELEKVEFPWQIAITASEEIELPRSA